MDLSTFEGRLKYGEEAERAFKKIAESFGFSIIHCKEKLGIGKDWNNIKETKHGDFYYTNGKYEKGIEIKHSARSGVLPHVKNYGEATEEFCSNKNNVFVFCEGENMLDWYYIPAFLAWETIKKVPVMEMTNNFPLARPIIDIRSIFLFEYDENDWRTNKQKVCYCRSNYDNLPGSIGEDVLLEKENVLFKCVCNSSKWPTFYIDRNNIFDDFFMDKGKGKFIPGMHMKNGQIKECSFYTVAKKAAKEVLEEKEGK